MVDSTCGDYHSRSIDLPVLDMVYGLAWRHSIAVGNFSQLPRATFLHSPGHRNCMGGQLFDRLHHCRFVVQTGSGAKLGLGRFAPPRIYHIFPDQLRECFPDALCSNRN